MFQQAVMPEIHMKESSGRPEYQRVTIHLLGRYMLEDRREYPCRTIDISPGGIALAAPVKGKLTERVVVYLDQLGRIEGMITRTLDNGFAISMNHAAGKIDRLADRLTWLANRQYLGMAEDRRHERIIPLNKTSTIIFENGEERPTKLLDISISGSAVASDHQPKIGTKVTLGKTDGIVVRHFGGGFAVEFSRPFSDEEFSPSITL